MMTEQEYMAVERQRANSMVTMILNIIDMATEEAEDDGLTAMGYREHKELIDAYNEGLCWWVNHDGGVCLDRAFIEYLRTLKRNKYEFQDIYDDYGIEE